MYSLKTTVYSLFMNRLQNFIKIELEVPEENNKNNNKITIKQPRKEL